MTVSCLIYGFGLGIEQYCIEIVVKEHLGVKNWTKVEGTIDALSGIFLCAIFSLIINFFMSNTLNAFIKKCFKFITYSHLTIFSVWIIFPAINYIKYYRKNQKRLKNRYSFMQHS